jgi:predicted metal-dependent phosphoesterase TrpH
MSIYDNCSKGSEWRKWDLHFHTPSSHDYHDKSISDEDIIKILHENNISVVCVSDHNTIDTQRVKNLQTLGSGKVVVLPGIEFS